MNPAVLLLLVSAQATESQMLLRRARATVEESVGQLLGTSCVQELEQTRYRARKPVGTDRARLRVSVAKGTEVFSWPDGVHTETSGSGDFYFLLTTIFLKIGAEFGYVGDTVSNRIELAEYIYKLPEGGLDGNLWVDTQTADLKRLTVRAASATTEIEYQRLDGLLVPKITHREALSPAGEFTITEIRYRTCGPMPQPSPRETIHEPQGRSVTLKLTTPIDSAKAWAGDPVEATLNDTATIHGHLVRVEKRTSRFPTVVLGLEFDDIALEFHEDVSQKLGVSRDNVTFTREKRPGLIQLIFYGKPDVYLPAGHTIHARTR